MPKPEMKYTVNVLIDGCYNKSEDNFTTTNEVRYLSFIAFQKDFFKGREFKVYNYEVDNFKLTTIIVEV